MQENKTRKVFLDELPHTYKGVDWLKCKGLYVHFIYDEIEGNVKIIDFDVKTHQLTIKYLDKIIKILSGNFIKCKLTNLLNKRTSDFRIEIGTIFKDDKRDITIIDREYRPKEKIDKLGRKTIQKLKYYKYHCNKDGYEDWIIENHVKDGSGCSCCSSKELVLGINTIWDTDPWMIPIIGEEIAKTHTYGSNYEVFPICPDCGRKKSKKMEIRSIYSSHSIGCSCSDGKSYGEKFVLKLLEQLKLNFINEYSPVWINQKRYDFYLSDFNSLIEVHGMQHYEDCKFTMKNARTYAEEVINDKFKKDIALQNGINKENYIIIDCRYSKLEWIKKSILDSKLNKLFDLSKINWIQCEEFAVSNLLKVICEYKKDNFNMFSNDIATKFNIDKCTVNRYLNKGNKIWDWCNYKPKEEQRKSGERSGNLMKKPIKVFKDGLLKGEFSSAKDLEKQSEELFNTKLIRSLISEACRNIRKEYKGFTFEYA